MRGLQRTAGTLASRNRLDLIPEKCDAFCRLFGAGAPTLELLVLDSHGNDVGMVALTGILAYERTYSPWGEVVSSMGSPPQQGYCANLGHRQDAESALTYMRARYYDPATGRFLTEDPARDGANWYAYCDHEPIGRTDPTGRWIEIGGIWFSFDHPYSQEGSGKLVQDLTWGYYKGDRRGGGSIRPDGSIKHGKELSESEVRRLQKALRGNLSGRGQGFLRKLARSGGYGVLSGGFVMTSLDGAFMSDPAGFHGLVQEVGGEWSLFEGWVTVGQN